MNTRNKRVALSVLAALGVIFFCLTSGIGREYFSTLLWAQDATRLAERRPILLDRPPDSVRVEVDFLIPDRAVLTCSRLHQGQVLERK